MASMYAAAPACSSSLKQENSAAAVAHAQEALPVPPYQTVNMPPPANRLENGAAAHHAEEHPTFNVKQFEDQVRSAKLTALLVAGLQLASRFFGFCALTWATVVLLGGFASTLRRLDFLLISILLLLEAVRLFIIQMFSKFLSRALFREGRLPKNFTFTDRQPFKALLLDLLGQGLSFILAAASLISSILRFSLSGGHPLSEKNPPQDDGPSNLPISLHIFYVLVILYSVSAIASSLLRPFLRQRCDGNSIFSLFACFNFHESSSAEESIKQNSLMCFHDEVYKTALEAGMPEADQLDILDFAFTKLASDYKRNIRPALIKELNRDMIRYLYNGQHGIAMVCEYLKSGDVWKQLVAASLPGFWVEEKKLRLQLAVFWALQARMSGGGKDAKSALNSIQCLGKAWAADATSYNVRDHPFLLKDPATDTNVVDTLVSLILVPIRPSLLFQVKAFEACCRHPKVLGYFYKAEGDESGNPNAICTSLQDLIVQIEAAAGGQDGPPIRPEWQSRLRVLCCKLHSIVAGREGRNWTPTRVYASKALLNLLCNGSRELLGQGIKDCIAKTLNLNGGIDPVAATATGNYFSVNDMKDVEKVRFMLNLNCYPHWKDVRLRQENGKELKDLHAIYAIVDEARQ